VIHKILTSSCASEPCRSRFPCGKKVRWLGWSRLTDLAQSQSSREGTFLSRKIFA
jgi:hypothetical protein